MGEAVVALLVVGISVLTTVSIGALLAVTLKRSA